MDIYKCPKSISLFDFWKKYLKKNNIYYTFSHLKRPYYKNDLNIIHYINHNV